MKKILRNILILVVLLVVVALAARNLLIKSAVTRTIEKETGFGVEMEGVKAGLLKPTFEVTGLRLINPEDFADATALEIDRFFVEYDLRSLLTEEIHLRKVIMDIPRVVVVEKEDGETNFQRLAQKTREAAEESGKGKAESGTAEESQPEAPAEPLPETEPEPAKPEKRMRIDELTIKMGTAEVRKYTREDPKPKVKTYPIDQERTYRNITDP
ncbi:MAG: hypothetical protein JXB04_01010, partial [Kiritimatiellae bacterium]|nr:hypothetical protein [Kiritimatiellia bacterium]